MDTFAAPPGRRIYVFYFKWTPDQDVFDELAKITERGFWWWAGFVIAPTRQSA